MLTLVLNANRFGRSEYKQPRYNNQRRISLIAPARQFRQSPSGLNGYTDTYNHEQSLLPQAIIQSALANFRRQRLDDLY